MKAKIPKILFPFKLRLLSRERALIGHLLYTVSRQPLNLCMMMILLIFDFFCTSTVDPKYWLLAVDLFTSKTYTNPMKSRHLLAQKMELFYRDIS